MNLETYQRFVEKVTSEPSNDLSIMNKRMEELSKDGKVNLSLLLTGSLGLSSECGEFTEIVKKVIFQGKPLDKDNIYHMKRELGDILWYWVNACRSLGLNPNDVLMENVEKLQSRYPGGKFEDFYSENRKEGDL
jgi:NTP pyrophosphatase (non-canonical NTP hydrolase)